MSFQSLHEYIKYYPQTGGLEEALQFIDALRHENTFNQWSSLTKLLIRGLVEFYGGDPLAASVTFEQVDSENEQDVMGQYYLLRSIMESSPTPDLYTQEWEFSLKQADKVREAADPSTFPALQWYYAGQLYYLASQFDKAICCFTVVQDRELAALYMRFLIAEQQQDFANRDEFRYQILHEETLRKKGTGKGSQGFLEQSSPGYFSLLDPHCTVPFFHYARSLEIQEAIQLLHEWLDTQRDAGGCFPSYLSWIESHDVAHHSLEKPLVYFHLLEKHKRELQALTAEGNVRRIERLKAALNSHFTVMPSILSEQPAEPVDCEQQLGALLESQMTSLTQTQWHHLLAYYYAREEITAEALVLLDLYGTVRIRTPKGLVPTSIEDALKSGWGAALGALFAAYQLTNPAIIALSALGGGFVKILIDFCRERFGTSVQAQSYLHFKEHFINYIDEQREKLGAQFPEVYALLVDPFSSPS